MGLASKRKRMDTNRIKYLIGALALAIVIFVVAAASPGLYVPWTSFRGTNGMNVSTNPSAGIVTIDKYDAGTHVFSVGSGGSNPILFDGVTGFIDGGSSEYILKPGGLILSLAGPPGIQIYDDGGDGLVFSAGFLADLFNFRNFTNGGWFTLRGGQTNYGPTKLTGILDMSWLLTNGTPFGSVTGLDFVSGITGYVATGRAKLGVSVSGGSSGPTTNAPPYTVPITGTNFIIDWLALGATNDVILTNYANAGVLHTNIIPAKRIIARIDQGSQGFCTLVANTNNFGPNNRFTLVITGITQSTNGGYQDLFGWCGIGTNAVAAMNNWGAAP